MHLRSFRMHWRTQCAYKSRPKITFIVSRETELLVWIYIIFWLIYVPLIPSKETPCYSSVALSSLIFEFRFLPWVDPQTIHEVKMHAPVLITIIFFSCTINYFDVKPKPTRFYHVHCRLILSSCFELTCNCQLIALRMTLNVRKHRRTNLRT